MSNKNIICTGIDRGFGVTKYYSDYNHGGIDSLVAPIPESRAKELIANNKDDSEVIVLKKDNNYFLIGSYVAKVEPQFAERDLRRKRDNTNENILFLTALGLATEDLEEANVIITTGLPTDDYIRLKESYSQSVLNNKQPYVFSILKNGKEFKKSITVVRANVENQPKGTIISVIEDKMENEGMDWDELKTRRFAICDIGFNTTDLSIYVGKDMVRGEKINYSTFAMVQIVNTCKRLIEDHFVCVKNESEVLESMKTGEIKIKGKLMDCSEIIQEGFMKNAELLITELSSKWENYLDTFDEIILTGGALNNENFAAILKDQIAEKCGWETTVCKNPQYANAQGFFIISTSLFAQAFKAE